MITASEKNETFLQKLQGSQKDIKRDFPAWTLNWQKQYLNRVEKAGFPTIKDEEWKYLNVKPILERTYHIPSKTAPTRTDTDGLTKYLDPREINVVFINGIFSPEFSHIKKLPKGLRLLTLEEAFKDKQIDLENFFKKADTNHETSFAALTKALAHSGLYIEVEKKAVIQELVHIVHVTGGKDQETLTTPYSIIRLGESSEAGILESFVDFNNASVYFTDALTEIWVAENATIKYCKAQSEGLKSFHIGSTRAWLERNANFSGFSFSVGGAITRNNLDITLNGEGAAAVLNGLYCVNNDQVVDNHTLVDHREPNCTSNQLYKGILNGSSRAVFNGKIFVQPIAQKTNSYQLNKNLLLGKDAQVNTKPQLEIGADDVKCTHGATIGQLNEDEIFYLQSRCISRKAAISMLSHGFVDEIIGTIQNDSIAQKLNGLLAPTFAAL